jgi:tRNA threonylcarbamoyl adenosine modification protein YeaZ
MFTLILETSSEKGCLILAENGTPIAVRHLPAGPALSKSLALEVKALLQEKAVDCVAVGIGPGSYTGIRVGIALAKALSYGWKVPLVGFCSLEAFGPPPVVVDAKSGGFYLLLGKKAEKVTELKNLIAARSPHPESIKKRVDGMILTQAEVDPERLAGLVYERFLEGNFPVLEPAYLSFP